MVSSRHMGSIWGGRVRPVIHLASLVVFLLFLRTHLSIPTFFGVSTPLETGRDPVKQAGHWHSPRILLSIPDEDMLTSEMQKVPSEIDNRFLTRKVDHEQTLPTNISVSSTEIDPMKGLFCNGVRRHSGHENSCAFVMTNKQCSSDSLIDYTRFFFCSCAKMPVVGYIVLALWLVALFYMLGNTAADYFCCSLEKLSNLLRCPATVAGVTLLPLGNGAPDVFASIAAFLGAGAGQVGLNSVLGGAVFVTSVVVGCVNLLAVGAQSVNLDCRCFVRDVCFFLFTLMALFLILMTGNIYLWGAIAFLSIYALYAVAVAVSEVLKKRGQKLQWCPMQTLPFIGAKEDDDSVYAPLLDPELLPKNVAVEASSLPQWMWASNVAIYSHQPSGRKRETPRPLWGWSEEQESGRSAGFCSVGCICKNLVELPITLPRRLTIPIVEKERWSRGFAVASAGLAPNFLAFVLDSEDSKPIEAIYVGGAILGAMLALLAFFTTNSEHPPRRFLFPWVAAGFLMSILWFYVIANELVALLVSFGTILEIDPSILALTVLAWGNSMGDLMANIALACNGGDGVQIAMSGCYAGPMFNTLIGLGISLTLSSWGTYPAPFAIPRDYSLYYTLSFLVAALLWALTILPMNGMQPSKLLGVGLLIIYLLFLTLRLSHALGFVSIVGL